MILHIFFVDIFMLFVSLFSGQLSVFLLLHKAISGTVLEDSFHTAWEKLFLSWNLHASGSGKHPSVYPQLHTK